MTVPDARLRIIGDGPLRPDLERWIRDHDAEGWVTLLGRVTPAQLRDEYRRAWVVGSASLAEGWGLSLTEAAACGTPAVATDISGHRCSVVDGETGLLAPDADLGDALARVLGDPDLRRRLGAAAHARASTLTWEASARGVLAVLHRAVLDHPDQAPVRVCALTRRQGDVWCTNARLGGPQPTPAPRVCALTHRGATPGAQTPIRPVRRAGRCV